MAISFSRRRWAKDRISVYAVNPNHAEILGARCYPTVTDIPEAPDLVAIVVRHDQVLDVLKASYEKNAKSAIVISAGFAERVLKAGHVQSDIARLMNRDPSTISRELRRNRGQRG